MIWSVKEYVIDTKLLRETKTSHGIPRVLRDVPHVQFI